MRVMKDSGVEWIGEIPIDWDTAKAKYVFSVVNGATPRSDEPDNWEGNIVWVTPTDMKQPLETLTISEKSITEAGLGSCGTTIVPRGSIVLSTRAPIGKIAYAGVDLCTNQGCKTLVAKKDLSSRFIGYYLFSISDFLVTLGRGTTFIELSTYDLLNLRLPYPTKIQQDRALAYLGAKCAQIDRAIARQQEVIEKLKEYKLSVITEAVTKGLNPDVTMKDSGIEWIGEIPEGWNVSSLGYNVELIQTGPFGSQLHAEDYTDEGVYVINPANIQNGKLYLEGAPTISNQKATELSQHLLVLGDIVFARRGEMGRCACIEDDEQCFCGTGCMKVKCGNNLSPKFAILYLQIPFMKQYLELNSVGTTMANLNSSIISGIPMIIPPFCEQEEIVMFLRHKSALSDDVIAGKQKIIDKLTEYKKSLIYEVVTGKREV